MIKRPNTNAQRLKRHKRVRAKISGTPEMPRLNVFRSEANIYAQVIDDVNGVTSASASPDKAIEGHGGNIAPPCYRWRAGGRAPGARRYRDCRLTGGYFVPWPREGLAEWREGGLKFWRRSERQHA